MSRQHFALAGAGGLLTVAVLVVVPMKAAENGNPFAQWERLKSQTDVTEVTPPKPVAALASEAASKLEYSSSDAAPDAAKKTISAKNTTVTKERLKVDPVVETPVAVAATKKSAAQPSVRKEPVVTDVNHWNKAFDQQSGTAEVQQVSQTSAEETPSVENAVFAAGENEDSGIQQTRGDFFDEVAEESDENPFAEFLGEPEISTAPGVVPVRTVTATETLPELEEPTAPSMSPEASTLSASQTLDGPQTPAVTIQWVHHGDFNVGQESHSELVLKNTGKTPVRNVVAEAMLPQGLQVVSAVPAPTTAGGNASWSFGELQPGQTRSVDLVIVPTTQGEINMSAFVRMTGGTTSTFSVREPKLAVRVEGPPTIEVGQQVNYTVHVANPGTGKANNVTIQCVIPEGLEHRHGNRLTIDIGTLNPGELRRARLSVTGVKGGAQKLAVRAIGDGNLTDEVMETVAVAEPKLNIGLRGPETTTTGQPETYELVVVNEGRVDSNNVRVKYRLPEGFELVTADGGGKLNESDATVDWFVGTLEPEQSHRLNLTLRSTAAGNVTHQVGVMSEHGSMAVANHQINVSGSAELELKVVSTQPTIAPGEETIFEIRISNAGTSAAKDVGLSCELPAGLQLVDVSGPSEYIADSGAIIFRAMPDLAAGKTVLFAVKAKCTRAGSHKLRVRVASESISDALIGEATTNKR